MARFVVEGGTPLRGEITPAGNKNEALPLIAAALLTDEPVTLHNVPRIAILRPLSWHPKANRERVPRKPPFFRFS